MRKNEQTMFKFKIRFNENHELGNDIGTLVYLVGQEKLMNISKKSRVNF